jgi:mono/diheme cytochrome c family protein
VLHAVVLCLRRLAMPCAVALSCAAPPTAHAGERKVDLATPAAAIYHNYCSVCHGDHGDGQSRARGSLNPPPRDFTSAQAPSELTRERMLAAVTHGVPGTAMVGFRSQLAPAQIAAVVDHVRERFMRANTLAGASRGQRIYAKTCSVCHGDRGTGSAWAGANLTPAPRDFSSAAARAELTRERMLVSVAGGRSGTAMSGFATQLSRDDIAAVVDYIRGAFMQVGADTGISGTRAHAGGAPPASAQATGVPAVRADMSLALPHALIGQAAAGKRFYAANCATCHGAKGDGQGPRAYFINPKPRNFVSAESRALLNRPAIYAAVAAGKLGTEMPAWDKVLTPQQIADVSEYVYQAFTRADATQLARRASAP